MLIRRLFVTILILAFFTAPAFAWDNNTTHPGITNAAIDFLANTNPDYTFLENYAHFNINTDPQLTFIDEGSVKEDYALSADWDTSIWGSRQDPNVPDLSWKSHGYDPLTGETWYGIPDFDNAFVYSESIWNVINTAGNRYFQIGRFCHLIEDMSSPAHANADFHGTGDDAESFSQYHYHEIAYQVPRACLPSTDGLVATSGLPNPTLTTNNYGNFIRNVAWRTYYMTTYYGGHLVEREGDAQPDSELKRMFPYRDGGLRYDDGGWFYNDSYVIDDVGNDWIGWGIGMNPDWWDAPGDSGYFYLEDIDGDPDSMDPSIAGSGVVPKVFKINKFRRVLPTDNLNDVLAPNNQILARIYCENLFPMAAEWVAGFLEFTNPTN